MALSELETLNINQVYLINCIYQHVSLPFGKCKYMNVKQY